MTGYQGSSSDYYQANISISQITNTNLDLNIIVTNDTEITHITIYVLVADLTDLAV